MPDDLKELLDDGLELLERIASALEEANELERLKQEGEKPSEEIEVL